MSVPGAISVPGGELVLRVRDIAPSPATTVIVNCAGRTRSIIGTQSLVNAGIRNPVYALRNGTIGWTLAGLPLEQQQSRRYGAASDTAHRHAVAQARQVADRAGVARIDATQLARWQQEARTTYLFDVRDADEFAAGHLPGSRHVPGGQLVQETDHYASVRGARRAPPRQPCRAAAHQPVPPPATAYGYGVPPARQRLCSVSSRR